MGARERDGEGEIGKERRVRERVKEKEKLGKL